MNHTQSHKQSIWVVAAILIAWVMVGCGRTHQQVVQADKSYRVAQEYLGGQSYLLAEQEIRKALDAAPGDARYVELLALIYQAQGRIKHADEAYQAALQQKDVSASALVNYSSLLLLQERFDEAIAMAQRALQNADYLKPALAHTNIGLAHLKQGHLDRAAERFRTALDYQPTLPEARHNLGLVQARQGAYDDAILSFREAIRVRPSYTEAYVSLAQVLLEQGRQQEARSAFERVIDLAPDSPQAVASRRQLQRLAP
jgi:Tfp pilus assembly protein PilF